MDMAHFAPLYLCQPVMTVTDGLTAGTTSRQPSSCRDGSEHQPHITPAAAAHSCCCCCHLQADEIFTTGTAVVVCSVGSLTYRGNKRSYVDGGEPGSTALQLYTALTQLQTCQAEDPLSWVYKVC